MENSNMPYVRYFKTNAFGRLCLPQSVNTPSKTKEIACFLLTSAGFLPLFSKSMRFSMILSLFYYLKDIKRERRTELCLDIDNPQKIFATLTLSALKDDNRQETI